MSVWPIVCPWQYWKSELSCNTKSHHLTGACPLCRDTLESLLFGLFSLGQYFMSAWAYFNFDCPCGWHSPQSLPSTVSLAPLSLPCKYEYLYKIHLKFECQRLTKPRISPPFLQLCLFLLSFVIVVAFFQILFVYCSSTCARWLANSSLSVVLFVDYRGLRLPLVSLTRHSILQVLTTQVLEMQWNVMKIKLKMLIFVFCN